MKSSDIVLLSEENLDAAAKSLAQAFHDDPLQKYVFPNAEERAARSPAHFAPLLRYGMLFGEVLTTKGYPLGAAVWLPPETWEVTPERATAAGLDDLPNVLGEDAAGRFFTALGATEPYHKQDVPPSHWYLMVVGVSPEARGRGLGRALLEPIMKRADASGLPCYLETAQPDNVAYYEHLGFKNVVDMIEPQSGLRLWTFRRDPPAQNVAGESNQERP
ncbi:MAG TPA: GNAT family N-acetyltransferase [Pyrinomonadaceae bacterium]|jgi:ribosomal protein S18 acetylase RimI-like enzyme